MMIISRLLATGRWMNGDGWAKCGNIELTFASEASTLIACVIFVALETTWCFKVLQTEHVGVVVLNIEIRRLRDMMF